MKTFLYQMSKDNEIKNLEEPQLCNTYITTLFNNVPDGDKILENEKLTQGVHLIWIKFDAGRHVTPYSGSHSISEEDKKTFSITTLTLSDLLQESFGGKGDVILICGEGTVEEAYSSKGFTYTQMEVLKQRIKKYREISEAAHQSRGVNLGPISRKKDPIVPEKVHTIPVFEMEAARVEDLKEKSLPIMSLPVLNDPFNPRSKMQISEIPGYFALISVATSEELAEYQAFPWNAHNIPVFYFCHYGKAAEEKAIKTLTTRLIFDNIRLSQESSTMGANQLQDEQKQFAQKLQPNTPEFKQHFFIIGNLGKIKEAYLLESSTAEKEKEFLFRTAKKGAAEARAKQHDQPLSRSSSFEDSPVEASKLIAEFEASLKTQQRPRAQTSAAGQKFFGRKR